MRIFVYTQYSDKTMITDKKAAELILGYFVRRGTARAQPLPAGARARLAPAASRRHCIIGQGQLLIC